MNQLNKLIKAYNGWQDKYKVETFESVDFYAIVKTDSVQWERGFYELFTDPQFNFIPLLLKDEEWSGKFWTWMYDNNNACKSSATGITLMPEGCNAIHRPTPQMLVGYVLQFLQETVLQGE